MWASVPTQARARQMELGPCHPRRRLEGRKGGYRRHSAGDGFGVDILCAVRARMLFLGFIGVVSCWVRVVFCIDWFRCCEVKTGKGDAYCFFCSVLSCAGVSSYCNWISTCPFIGMTASLRLAMKENSTHLFLSVIKTSVAPIQYTTVIQVEYMTFALPETSDNNM